MLFLPFVFVVLLPILPTPSICFAAADADVVAAADANQVVDGAAADGAAADADVVVVAADTSVAECPSGLLLMD